MEEQCVTALVAIDLSAAFDHNVLIKVLNKKFGLSNTALMLFESYLQPRQFKVCVKGQYSTEGDLKFSVPQGSCAGPTLYLAYASTIQEIIPKNIDIHGYADDHVLKNKFYPSKENDEFDCVMSLEKTLVDVNEWMNQNRLKMNNAKTEYIMFGSCQQLGKCNSSGINVNGAAVERATKIKYLELHWLPIKYRVQYKILILVHKCIKGEAPTYLIDLIKEQPISRQGLRSASRLHHLQIPATKRKIFADRSFSVSGPRLWNSLADNIKTLNDNNIFKKMLKTLFYTCIWINLF